MYVAPVPVPVPQLVPTSEPTSSVERASVTPVLLGATTAPGHESPTARIAAGVTVAVTVTSGSPVPEFSAMTQYVPAGRPRCVSVAPAVPEPRGATDHAWRVLATLPPKQRATLVLRVYEDLPDAEIAELLGTSEAAVRSNASRGLAALRATTEDTIRQNGEELPAVRGRLLDGRQAAFYPGELPADPAVLLHPARDGAPAWLDADYAIMNFAPAPMTARPGDGPPHIRLDRAAEFLIGDRL